MQVQLAWDNFLLKLLRRCASVARYYLLTYSNKLAGNLINAINIMIIYKICTYHDSRRYIIRH